MSPVEGKEKVSAKELYQGLIELVKISETISWGRFNSFLLFNSILILAWSTVFTSKIILNSGLSLIVLVAIVILGMTSGVFWAGLGKRGRAFVKHYLDQASYVEKDKDCWGEELKKYKPLTKAAEMRDNPRGYYSSSYFLLRAVPWSFTILHGILLVVTVLRIVNCREVLDFLTTFLR